MNRGIDIADSHIHRLAPYLHDRAHSGIDTVYLALDHEHHLVNVSPLARLLGKLDIRLAKICKHCTVLNGDAVRHKIAFQIGSGKVSGTEFRQTGATLQFGIHPTLSRHSVRQESIQFFQDSRGRCVHSQQRIRSGKVLCRSLAVQLDSGKSHGQFAGIGSNYAFLICSEFYICGDASGFRHIRMRNF